MALVGYSPMRRSIAINFEVLAKQKFSKSLHRKDRISLVFAISHFTTT